MTDDRLGTLANRSGQMFPRLADEEVARLTRFGEPQSYSKGEMLRRLGEHGHGLTLVLSGKVEVTRLEHGQRTHVATHERGNFIGELAQLSGRPYLADAEAITDVEAVNIPPEKLRALLIAEADLGEHIMRALILRRMGLIEAGAGPIIVGPEANADVLRLTNFLRRNGHPYQHLDAETDSCGHTLVERFHVTPEELPIVLCPTGQMLRNPTEAQIARCIGLVGPIDPNKLYDVVIVGAGPAGLATAVYAGSEGLSVLAIDCRSFGGQAGASARIENYLGFPTGISGMALMGRAFSQAQKFGVEILIPDEAVRLECGSDPCRIALGTKESIQARSVVLAMGARYRRLGVEKLEEYEGSSVHYWASPLEADLCADQEVALVGGGNSAGQAVVFLASRAGKVTLIARRPLSQTMSAYLIERIASLPNVDVVIGCEIAALEGEPGQLAGIRIRQSADGSEQDVRARFLFSFIGAEPNTDWLEGSGLKLDERGFVHTGEEIGEDRLPLETSRNGVFAVGDVRACSVKRVAAAVGDGAQVVASIHAYLAKRRETEQPTAIEVQVPANA